MSNKTNGRPRITVPMNAARGTAYTLDALVKLDRIFNDKRYKDNLWLTKDEVAELGGKLNKDAHPVYVRTSLKTHNGRERWISETIYNVDHTVGCNINYDYFVDISGAKTRQDPPIDISQDIDLGEALAALRNDPILGRFVTQKENPKSNDLSTNKYKSKKDNER